MLAVEGYADTYTGVVLDTVTTRLIIRVFVGRHTLVSLALNHQATTASGNKPLENLGEFLGYLLEGPLNGLILALIENLDEILN